MLRITQSTSVDSAKTYYTSGLSKESYYSQGQEIVGSWGGKAAERLSLVGQVQEKAFVDLCENVNPNTGKNLTPMTKSNRCPGYDMNFHCPKSVSLIYSQTGDEKILDAFRNAVHGTMVEMETEMQTRVRRGGRYEDRLTGNMVWSEFIHFTARPVGGIPDPHLHAHCFTFNATFDDTERCWKAGKFKDLNRDMPYYEAGFHARFARELAGQGYTIERNQKGWEIGGVSRGLIDRFSRRTELIEEVARKEGITNDKIKDRLGAKTRELKRTDLTQADLKAVWDGMLGRAEKEALKTAKTYNNKQPGITSGEAMDYALTHSFERSSVLSEKRFMREALRHGVGAVSVGEIRSMTAASQVLLRAKKDGQVMCTTKDVLKEEKAMIGLARGGRGRCKGLNPAEYTFEAGFLNKGQRQAVSHVLTSHDRVILISGGAGTGKTTMMQEAVRGINQGGKSVYTFAPSAEASRNVLRKEGFGNAETVARLILSKDIQEQVRNQVIWIDEAGLIGSRTMKQVFDIAVRQNARIILSGDEKQHKSVERGDAFRILQEKAGLKVVRISRIQRQRERYKDAVKEISNDNIAEGLEKLDDMNAIIEVDDDERLQILASDYLQAVKDRKTALVVSPTHNEGEKVNGLIRMELKKAGRIGNIDEVFRRYKNLSWTEAERGDARNYAAGQMVQFHEKAKGFKRGDRGSVVGHDRDGNVIVADLKGANVPLPIDQAKRFQVYESRKISLARGDKIRITHNGKEGRHRLINGTMYDIKGFSDKGNIILSNGWELDKNYGHIAHGYCTTSNASQGKTVDRVFIAQGTDSFPATSREQFYVSVSRGKESVKVYTDDKAELKKHVLKSGQRMSAMELELDKAVQKKERVKGMALLVNRLGARARAYAREKANELVTKYGRSREGYTPDTERGIGYERG